MARKVDKEGTKKRKEQILAAAYECFKKKGFHKSSMADICKKASLSPGTVYHYFKSKDDIILQFAEIELEKSREFAAALEQCDDVEELATLAVDGILEDDDDTDMQVYLEVLCEGGRNQKVGRRLLEADMVIYKALQKKLDDLDTGADASIKALASFIGGQMVFLELFKTESPSTKLAAEVSMLTKDAIRSALGAA